LSPSFLIAAVHILSSRDTDFGFRLIADAQAQLSGLGTRAVQFFEEVTWFRASIPTLSRNRNTRDM
jgi:hypothetical protein